MPHALEYIDRGLALHAQDLRAKYDVAGPPVDMNDTDLVARNMAAGYIVTDIVEQRAKIDHTLRTLGIERTLEKMP